MTHDIYDLFANDQLALDNQGIHGYDKSEKMQQLAIELQQRMQNEFLRKLQQEESR